MKGIIVVDTPECCDMCRFSSQAYDMELFEEGECYCTIRMKSVDDIEEGRKPDWCPIRPMPERKSGSSLTLSPLLRECLTDYEAGWNDCIDSIVGGGE